MATVTNIRMTSELDIIISPDDLRAIVAEAVAAALASSTADRLSVQAPTLPTAQPVELPTPTPTPTVDPLDDPDYDPFGDDEPTVPDYSGMPTVPLPFAPAAPIEPAAAPAPAPAAAIRPLVVTTSEAAAMLGTNPAAIRKLVNAGELRLAAASSRRTFRISVDSIQQYATRVIG